MNNKLTKLFAAAAIALTVAGCEESIPADKRYSPISVAPAHRAVLVEEYTGVNCINCPNGHKALEAIEEVYNTPDNLEQGYGVVTVGIHIPNWGATVDKGGYIAPEAESLTPDEVNPPQARVNRGGSPLDRPGWFKAIKNLITTQPKVTFAHSVLAEMKDASTIAVSGEVEATENLKNARLHVWVVEDNIVGRQRQPDGSLVRDYVHMNVFRGCANSVKGMEFALQRNTARQFNVKCAIDPKWNPENLRVVVFVETEADGVLNVAQNKLQINQ